MSHCFVVLFNVVLTLYLFLKIILDWANENLKESLWGVDDKQEKGKKASIKVFFSGNFESTSIRSKIIFNSLVNL